MRVSSRSDWLFGQREAKISEWAPAWVADAASSFGMRMQTGKKGKQIC